MSPCSDTRDRWDDRELFKATYNACCEAMNLLLKVGHINELSSESRTWAMGHFLEDGVPVDVKMEKGT